MGFCSKQWFLGRSMTCHEQCFKINLPPSEMFFKGSQSTLGKVTRREVSMILAFDTGQEPGPNYP